MLKTADVEFDYVLVYVLCVKLIIHFLPPETDTKNPFNFAQFTTPAAISQRKQTNSTLGNNPVREKFNTVWWQIWGGGRS
jgi:hypothetical protein